MNELTPEQIKNEMKKVKIPRFIKLTDKFWFKFGPWLIYIFMLSLIPLGVIYAHVNNVHTADIIWNIMVGIFIFLLFGLGGLMLINHLVKNNFVKKQAKRLGITVYEWNMYAMEIGLTSYKS